ncbi:NAD(P)-binding protein [Polyplosphaeria fusca]|uniref:NAD(P)-binding protein n=1 Tax=Polyplosphaeria fusca TaxID=682080 RepID=A0A9P4UVE1_9PLEO|nr:NAD(P)-binding protein [Polyplosphaeria fusca]
MASAAAKTIVLITGANSGIGLELAAQLLQKGTYTVLLCARSLPKGETALATLKSRSLPTDSATLFELDVTKDETIDRVAAAVESRYGHLDVLVNNAAVGLGTGTTREALRNAFDTNATGPLVMGEKFLHLLKKSTIPPSPRILNISSGAGSIGRRLDPTGMMYNMKGMYDYRASKAALSMVTACQVVEMGEFGIRVFAYDPGFTQSNLGPWNTKENGAREPRISVEPLVEVVEGGRDGEAGRFIHKDGGYVW